MAVSHTDSRQAPHLRANQGTRHDVRDECLALQHGACERRGVLGAEPLCDGRALVGEAVHRADGVGHDLGGDRAHVVVGHLRCPARLRRAGRPAAAALAAFDHRSLQRIGFRRCHRRCRHRCHGCLTRLGHRCRPRPNPLAASAAASRFASRSASSCRHFSSLSHWVRASAPMPPIRTSRGAAASVTSSADSPPPAMPPRSAVSARSAADTAGLGAAAGGGAGAAAGGASLGSSSVAAARPAFFFFLDFFEGTCALACSAASSVSSSSIAASALAARAACAACIASTAAADCRGTVCCRMRAAIAVWPLISANCTAVSPSLSSSSVLALARSSACTHATCPCSAACIRVVWPLTD
eukprot:scaffold48221_cov51-Phaeocystis_antarctica.AAC.7